jgi:hypothetical protein
MVDRSGGVTVAGRSWRLTAALVALLPALAPSPMLAEGDSSGEPGEAGRSEAARPAMRLIAQVEYLEDSTGRTYWDPSVFFSRGQAHVQAWFGEFTTGVEIGGFLRDSRRSTYAAFYRYRDDFDQVVDVSTEQLLGDGFVGYVGLRYIRVEDEAAADRDLLQPAIGLDKYYGDYHFFSARVYRDPREEHELTVVLANRVSNAPRRWLTLGLVPRTDGSTGWFVQGRWDIWRAGVGRYDRYDFTDFDRTVVNVGVEIDF